MPVGNDSSGEVLEGALQALEGIRAAEEREFGKPLLKQGTVFQRLTCKGKKEGEVLFLGAEGGPFFPGGDSVGDLLDPLFPEVLLHGAQRGEFAVKLLFTDLQVEAKAVNRDVSLAGLLKMSDVGILDRLSHLAASGGCPCLCLRAYGSGFFGSFHAICLNRITDFYLRERSSFSIDFLVFRNSVH